VGGLRRMKKDLTLGFDFQRILNRMKKQFGISLLALLTLSVVLNGCKEKPITTPGDLENPVIIMTSPSVVAFEDRHVVYSLDSFDVDVRFEDDFELRDYEITIRFKPELDYLRTANDPWSETYFGYLDGTSDAVNFRVYSVFNPTAGPYELTVRVTDEAGNITTQTTYLEVMNKADLLAPRVRFTSPDTVAVDTFTIGQNMPVQAIVSEPSPNVVRNIYLRVRDAVTKELMSGSEVRWDSLYLGTVLVDTFVTIPAGTVPGNYMIDLFANDPTNNVGKSSTPVYIKPN